MYQINHYHYYHYSYGYEKAFLTFRFASQDELQIRCSEIKKKTQNKIVFEFWNYKDDTNKFARLYDDNKFAFTSSNHN